jgi:molybdopterin molybdotransferase
MITFEEAYDRVLEFAFISGSQRVNYLDSLDRVLAEDVVSDMEMPPFNKAAVDGFACRKQDIKQELSIVEVIPAGKIPEKAIDKNECSRIMTGAMVPNGADIVIMMEDTELTPDCKVRFTKDKTNINISYRAEDLQEGDIVLKKGTLIRPQEIAIMASVGCTNPLVTNKPDVGIISTGDELVEPDQKPGISKIRNSNASQLISQVNRMGATAHYLGIARDDRDSTYKLISRALKENDIAILTGGVSMGERDYVPEVLNELGVDIQFRSIAIQPGRPTVFGIYGTKILFGLPGNPVSSFVIFEMLVKPMLYKIMGHHHHPWNFRLPMGIDYERSRSTRKSLLPVRVTDDGLIMPVEYHGSAHIHAYAHADGIITIDIGETKINKGDIVNVRPV